MVIPRYFTFWIGEREVQIYLLSFLITNFYYRFYEILIVYFSACEIQIYIIVYKSQKCSDNIAFKMINFVVNN